MAASNRSSSKSSKKSKRSSPKAVYSKPDALQRLGNNSWKRIFRRAGSKCTSRGTQEVAKNIARDFVYEVVRRATVYTHVGNRVTIKDDDVRFALESMDMPLFGSSRRHH
jgi:histone H3/H4